MSGDAWLDSIKRIVSQFAVTQHMISPYHIEVNGDRAVCLAYLQARHFPCGLQGRKISVGSGRVLHQHDAQNSQGWKIRIWKLTCTWQENAPNPESVAPDGA